jgi:hypothetical protein
MPNIYADEWYEAMFKLANSRDDLAKTVPQGEFCIAIEVEGDGMSPYVPEGETQHYFIRFVDGKCIEYKVCEEKIPGKGLSYRVIGPAHIFEGIAAETMDLIEAGLGGALTVRGDMRLLMQNAEIANVIFEVYTSSGLTEWPKGKPPYK